MCDVFHQAMEVGLLIFFKTSSFVFNERTKFIEVWNILGVSK